MSIVTITATTTTVTVDGCASGGTFDLDPDRGSWTREMSDSSGAVRLLAIARADTPPTVAYYTADGYDDFPPGWDFTHDAPAVLVVTTTGDATLG